MRFSAATLLTLAATLVAVEAIPQRLPRRQVADVNPFEGKVQYVGTDYATKLEVTKAAFLAAGDELNAGRVTTIQETVPTYIWVGAFSEIPKFRRNLEEAVAKHKDTKEKVSIPFVIYNLPERDCSAKASAGELSLDNDGAAKYRQFVDQIAALINEPEFRNFDYTIVVEPDSLGNLVTNMSVEKCQKAAPAYNNGIGYTIAKLQQSNVALYLDAAHSNWLGWPGNLEPTAKAFKTVVDIANNGTANATMHGFGAAKIRGFATNVSNLYPYNATEADPLYTTNPNFSELRYAEALSVYLEELGLPSHFIIDQGRAGKQGIREDGGNWCNINDAGYGIRPTWETGSPIVDAIVWVKPGGDSDGTSDLNSTRYDANCRSVDAKWPAPEAGLWFDEYAQMLVKNAEPPIEPTL